MLAAAFCPDCYMPLANCFFFGRKRNKALGMPNEIKMGKRIKQEEWRDLDEWRVLFKQGCCVCSNREMLGI